MYSELDYRFKSFEAPAKKTNQITPYIRTLAIKQVLASIRSDALHSFVSTDQIMLLREKDGDCEGFDIWRDPKSGQLLSSRSFNFLTNLNDAAWLKNTLLPDHHWSVGEGETATSFCEPNAYVWRKVCDADYCFSGRTPAEALTISVLECLLRIEEGCDE